MSKKSPKIAALIEQCRGQELPAHYLGYLECFNRGLFYEAHDVLEELWLADRKGPNYGFYKGLIQFAGAFVHLQKRRPNPAAALFKLSQSYLRPYAPRHERLDLDRVLAWADDWIEWLRNHPAVEEPLLARHPPTLHLD